jgi:hypothetical protein
MVFSFSVVGPPQRDDPGSCATRGKYQDMETIIDHAERAISYLAIILPVIDGYHSGVELEALDNCKIDTVIAKSTPCLRRLVVRLRSSK